MSNVVELQAAPYTARCFTADTVFGQFKAAGTRCGHIDFATPELGTYPLTPDEALSLIIALQNARANVLENSQPHLFRDFRRRGKDGGTVSD